MDCNSALALLGFDRPWASELDVAEADALRAHLARCPTCAAQAEHARRLDEQLKHAMGDVPVPEGLHGRLRERLSAERRLRLRRRWLRVAAAAAVLLLALGIGWYVRLSLRPVVDAGEIVRLFDYRPDSAEAMQERFREHYGISTVAPAQLNYKLLTWYGLTEFQGRQVPACLFVSQGASALVFVLSDSSFNLDADGQLQAPGSFHSVQVIRPADNPHVAFVILYTGGSLEPFFASAPSGV